MSLGNGQSLPLQEARNMELLLLQETSTTTKDTHHHHHHSHSSHGSRKGSSSSRLASLLKASNTTEEVLDPLIRAAYDSIPDPVIVLLVSTGTILYGNTAAGVTFGLSNKESSSSSLRGLSILSLLPELSLNKLQSLAQCLPSIPSSSSSSGTSFQGLVLPATSSLSSSSSNGGRNIGDDETTTELTVARGPGGLSRFPVSLSFGRLGREGLLTSDLTPGDITVMTLKKTLFKNVSGSCVSRYRSEFEEIRSIGRGAFGIVVQAKNRLDGQEYAIKKVRLSCSPENLNIFTNASTPSSKVSKWFKRHQRNLSESDSRLLNEVKTFALLSNHPNVIRYYNAWIEPKEETSSEVSSASTAYDSDSDESLDYGEQRAKQHHSTLFIQMQLCPYQDLRKWISSRDAVKLEPALSIFWQIVSGLVHIHSQGVIHRDVKPENIFVHNDHVFLGDFGLAKNIQEHALSLSSPDSPSKPGENSPSPTLKTTTSKLESYVASTDDGTYIYMAPEILSSQLCTTKSDIYSLGVILFELLTHFDTAMERVVTLNELKESGRISPLLAETFPLQVTLLEELLAQDPQCRPTAQEILANELFYDVTSRRGTASSFGGSGTESPSSADWDHCPLGGSTLMSCGGGGGGVAGGCSSMSNSTSCCSNGGGSVPRRRSGESARDPWSRVPLRCSKSVISLDSEGKGSGSTLPRYRRVTEDLTWMPWGPFNVHDDLVGGNPGTLLDGCRPLMGPPPIESPPPLGNRSEFQGLMSSPVGESSSQSPILSRGPSGEEETLGCSCCTNVIEARRPPPSLSQSQQQTQPLHQRHSLDAPGTIQVNRSSPSSTVVERLLTVPPRSPSGSVSRGVGLNGGSSSYAPPSRIQSHQQQSSLPPVSLLGQSLHHHYYHHHHHHYQPSQVRHDVIMGHPHSMHSTPLSDDSRVTPPLSVIPSSGQGVAVDPKDRIKSLERDVACLEAKLSVMTVRSLRLESELAASTTAARGQPLSELPPASSSSSQPHHPNASLVSLSPSSSGTSPPPGRDSTSSSVDSGTLPIPIPSSSALKGLS